MWRDLDARVVGSRVDWGLATTPVQSRLAGMGNHTRTDDFSDTGGREPSMVHAPSKDVVCGFASLDQDSGTAGYTIDRQHIVRGTPHTHENMATS